jgi:hypothetical protein
MWLKEPNKIKIHQTFGDGVLKKFMGVNFFNHRPMFKLLPQLVTG